MALPAPALGSEIGVDNAVRLIAIQLKRPLLDRQQTVFEGQVILSFLERSRIGPSDIPALLSGLSEKGELHNFFQTAHPQWGSHVRNWLAENDVPWSTVHAYYRYSVSDSLNVFFGFVAGMGVSLAEVPIMLSKLSKTIIDGKLSEETEKFFAAIGELIKNDLSKMLGDMAAAWMKIYDDHVYKFEWFEAGFHVGRTVTNIAFFGLGAAKAVIALPRFVKMVPLALTEVSVQVKRAASVVIRTLDEAVAFVREFARALYLAPNLRHSRLLPVILTPGELRQLLKGDKFRLMTKSGFELIYLDGAGSDAGAVFLRSGPLPSDFRPAFGAYIRKNGKIVGRIHDPHSLAHALRKVSDDDLDAFLKVLDDIDVPQVGLSSAEMRKLVDRARKGGDFADSVVAVNVRELAAEYANVVKQVRARTFQGIKNVANAQPSPSVFGTHVESAMKPLIQAWEKKFPHLLWHRKKKLKDILGANLPKESPLLKMTVAQYLRQNTLLAKQLGHDGKNLRKVLSADADTLIGDLEVDFLLMDPYGHQGLLLDFTSFHGVAHWNKNLLYHAVITDVYKTMRLPFGEMYHFGLVE